MSSSDQTLESLFGSSRSPLPSKLHLLALKRSLEAATFEGDFGQVDTILQTWTSTPSLPSPTPNEISPALDTAVLYGHLSVVRLLLDYGAPITISTAALASRDDKLNTLAAYKTFLQHGWSVQSPASKDGTMAMNLIMSNTDSESLLQWFHANGAPPNGLSSDPGSPPRYAVMRAPSSAIPSLLISHGATLRHTSVLHAAANRSGDDASIAMMECLLQSGVDINELGYEGWAKLPRGAYLRDWGTALHTIAKQGSVLRAKFLVEKGVDLGNNSRWGYTARDRAQRSGNEDVKRYLEAMMRERGMEVKDLEIKGEGPEGED